MNVRSWRVRLVKRVTPDLKSEEDVTVISMTIGFFGKSKKFTVLVECLQQAYLVHGQDRVPDNVSSQRVGDE